MTNLVVLTIDHPTTRYFANRISEDFGVDAVFIVENQNASRKIARGAGLLFKNPRKFLSRVFLFADTLLQAKLNPPARKRGQLHDEILGDCWRELKNTRVIRIRSKDLNKHETAMELRKFRPEIILLCAVPIVGSEIISSASRFCLNMHKGITPYYRGTNCLLWPLYNGEPDLVGVTIHKVDEGIDSGLIANQIRYKLEPGDTPFSIHLKATKLGTALMQKTLKDIQSSKFSWVKQDLSIGRVYYMKEFTFFKRLEVIKRLHNMDFPKRKRQRVDT